MTMGHRYVLTISPVIASDFGNYSCVSHNILGKESGPHTQVALTGKTRKEKRKEKCA